MKQARVVTHAGAGVGGYGVQEAELCREHEAWLSERDERLGRYLPIAYEYHGVVRGEHFGHCVVCSRG